MKCEVCGNDYDKVFEVVLAGEHHTFDSFECAIHRLAPLCAQCGCRIVGHGSESESRMYCCANCARLAGIDTIVDNTATRPSYEAQRRLS
jgi:hypothetical protein